MFPFPVTTVTNIQLAQKCRAYVGFVQYVGAKLKAFSLPQLLME
jgi:hypothetical protein